MVRTQGLLTSSTKIQKRPSRAQEGNSLTLTEKTRKAHAQAKLSSPSEHISFFTIIKTQVTWHGLTLYALNKSFPVMKNYWEVENLLCIQAHLIMMVDNCPLSSLRLLLATFTSHDEVFWTAWPLELAAASGLAAVWPKFLPSLYLFSTGSSIYNWPI